MAKDITVFEVKLDVSGAEKALEGAPTRGAAKADGTTTEGGTFPVGKRTPRGGRFASAIARRTNVDRPAPPKKLSALEKTKTEAERAADVTKKAGKAGGRGIFRRRAGDIAKFAAIIAGAAAAAQLALPVLTAGTSALKEIKLPEALGGSALLRPIAEALESAIDATNEGVNSAKAFIKGGALGALTDAKSISRAFGTIGELPSGIKPIEMASALFDVNEAEAKFKLDLETSLLKTKGALFGRLLTGIVAKTTGSEFLINALKGNYK